MVQEYGRYFGMPTVCFRGGCLTGPQHAGAELHGFLAYLMRCTVIGDPYTIFGYKGKQVRDNIHAHDVVRAFDAFRLTPAPAAVYNLGGGRDSNVLDARGDRALREDRRATTSTSRSAMRRASATTSGTSLTSTSFRADYPGWALTFGIRDVLQDIYACQRRALDCGHPRMKLSVVIPAFNEEGSIAETVTTRDRCPACRGVEYEIVGVDDASTDRTAAIISRWLASGPGRALCPHRPTTAASGFAVRAGLEAFTGDAVGDHDGRRLDDPDDLVALLPAARGRL